MNITLNNSNKAYYSINVPSDSSIKKAMEQVKKFYIATSGGPSLFQCFYTPSQLRHGFKILNEAEKSENIEAIRDAKLNIFTISVNSVYSLAALTSMFIGARFVFSCVTSVAAKLSPITGVVASSITSLVEARNLKKEYDFRCLCKQAIGSLKKGRFDKKSLHFILKYINTPEADPAKLSRLAHRVRPMFAEKLALELPNLIKTIQLSKNLKTRKETLEKVLFLLSDTKIQVEKKMIEQSLVIFANALLVTGFIAILTFQPYLIPLILFAASIAVVASNYFFTAGTENHTGWKFSSVDCLPFKSLREAFSKKS